MEKLNPNKLTTRFKYVTPTSPIIPRQYTLTHSDMTAHLFLTIGKHFAIEKISPTRDEVLAKWQRTGNTYSLYVYVQVDISPIHKTTSADRYHKYTTELPLALEAIRFGDNFFLKNHPTLDYAPIWVSFHSLYPKLNGIKYWGTLNDYK